MSLFKQMRKGRRKKALPLLLDRMNKNRTEVIAILLALTIIAIMATLSLNSDYFQADRTPIKDLPAAVVRCMMQNPSLLEVQCWDAYYNEKAINDGNESLCARISDLDLRRHCERYF